MIRAFVEGLLGSAGTDLLIFYETYSLPINAIVVLYGALLLISWTTYLRMYRHLAVLIAKEIHENPKLNKKSKVRQIQSTVEIPWDEVVHTAPFPLIARQGALIPRRKTVENMIRLTDQEELVDHGREVLRGTHPQKIAPDFFGRVPDYDKEEGNNSGEKPEE